MAKKIEDTNTEELFGSKMENTKVENTEELDLSLFDLGETEEFQDNEFRSFDITGIFSHYQTKINADGSKSVQLIALDEDEYGVPTRTTLKLNSELYSGAELVNKRLTFIGGKAIEITNDKGQTNTYYNAENVKIGSDRTDGELDNLISIPYCDIKVNTIKIVKLPTGKTDKNGNKILKEACYIRSVKLSEEGVVLQLSINVKNYNQKMIIENGHKFENKTIRVLDLKKSYGGNWSCSKMAPITK